MKTPAIYMAGVFIIRILFGDKTGMCKLKKCTNNVDAPKNAHPV